MIDHEQSSRPRTAQPRTAAALSGLALSLLSLSARAAPAPAPHPGDVQAGQVVAACAHAPAVTGEDAKGRYRACFQGGELVYIEEHERGAPKGSAARYLYEHGALVYFRTGVAPHATGGGVGADAATVPVTIEWSPAGEVRRAVRLEHYGEVKLAPDFVVAVRARGDALKAAAVAIGPKS